MTISKKTASWRPAAMIGAIGATTTIALWPGVQLMWQGLGAAVKGLVVNIGAPLDAVGNAPPGKSINEAIDEERKATQDRWERVAQRPESAVWDDVLLSIQVAATTTSAATTVWMMGASVTGERYRQKHTATPTDWKIAYLTGQPLSVPEVHARAAYELDREGYLSPSWSPGSAAAAQQQEEEAGVAELRERPNDPSPTL